jgi:glycosyltransferase involved in cell wall biosynthesis
MKIAYIYAGSWEFAYPQIHGDFDRRVWCESDDFIFKYPRAVMPYGVEPSVFYLSQRPVGVETLTHKYGFPLRRIPVRFRAGQLNYEISGTLFEELERWNYDLFHFYSYYRDRLYPDMFDLFALYCRLRGRPFVTHYQVGEFPRVYKGGRLKKLALQPRRLLKAWALRSARRIFSLNRREIGCLTNPRDPEFCGFSINPDRCVYLPNIVDQTLFHPMDRAEARREVGADGARKIMLYVGFLRREKGIQHAIGILPELLRRWPDLELWLVGNGDYEAPLRELARKLNVTRHLVFAGPVENSRLRPYYAMADAHLLPSYSESFGTVLIEAMACGVPSIGSAVGGIPEVLSGGAGILVPPRDEPALAAAVRHVLDGHFQIDARTRLEKLGEFSRDSAGAILEREYRACLSESPVRGAA